MKSSLEKVLEYKNEDIINRFVKMIDISEEEAEIVFLETKKWLWLCAQAKEDRLLKSDKVPKRIVIDNSLIIIDEMWHNFICFTKCYYDFCNDNFGDIIHHFPTPKKFNDSLKLKINDDVDFQRNRREKQYSYIYDLLGSETLTLWYETFADKYTPEFILKNRLK